MARKTIDLGDPKFVKQHVANMIASTGYQIVLQYLNIRREEIIAEMIEARANEKALKNISRLAGFDEVVKMINKLANLEVEEEDNSSNED